MVSILWKAFEIWQSFQKYVGGKKKKKSLPEVWPPTVKTDTAFSNSTPRSTDQHPEERIYILLEYNGKMKVCMLLNSTFDSIYILCFKLSAAAQGQALMWKYVLERRGKGKCFRMYCRDIFCLLLAWITAVREKEDFIIYQPWKQTSGNIKNVIIVCFCSADPAKNHIWRGYMPFAFLITYVYYTASIKR